MFKSMVLSAIVAGAWLLGAPAELSAYGARHVGYTHVGPNGVYHAGRTVGYGPNGAVSTGHAGDYGYGGTAVRTGYGAAATPYGASGYRYGAAVTPTGAAGAYRYGYRGW